MASDSGILWVSSKIVEPSQLSVAQFDDWYENEHALEVLALPGVPSAIRYKALVPLASPNLITYELPSLAYTSSPAFQAVASQSPPPDLVSRIYAHTSFDIRFYAELPAPAPSPAALPSPADPDASADVALACIALSPAAGRDAEFLLWFAKELAVGLGRVRGFARLRRFEFVLGGRLERNSGAESSAQRYLVLAQFERRVAEDEGVREEVETWVSKGGLASVEVGWYGVTKVWTEGEVQKLGEAP